MSVQAYYNTGTVTAANGSTALVGSGTSWAAMVKAGDIFWAAGLSARIASVTDNTHIVLAEGWPGTSLSGDDYEIRFTPGAADLEGSIRSLLTTLSNGILVDVADLTGLADGDLLQYDGVNLQNVGTAEALKKVLTTNGNIIRRIDDDVVEQTMAQLAVDLATNLAVINGRFVDFVATSNVDLSSGLAVGASAIDGVTLATSGGVYGGTMYALLTAQTTASENGIYPVVASGASTRAAEFSAASDLPTGLKITAKRGTTYANTTWQHMTAPGFTLDTTALEFVQHDQIVSATWNAVSAGGVTSSVSSIQVPAGKWRMSLNMYVNASGDGYWVGGIDLSSSAFTGDVGKDYFFAPASSTVGFGSLVSKIVELTSSTTFYILCQGSTVSDSTGSVYAERVQ